MKKLINLLEANVTVSSLNLSNTKTDNDGTNNDSISQTLLNDINTAAKNANVNITVTTAVSGHRETTSSGHPSRHTTGNAVDIAMINGKAVSSANRADADAFVSQLKSMGYDASGNESGHPKEVLWQVPQHYDHVHVSNTTDTPSTSDGGSGSTSGSKYSYTASEVGEPNDEFTQAAADMTKGFVTKATNALGWTKTESVSNKEKRLSENIQKIKRLL